MRSNSTLRDDDEDLIFPLLLYYNISWQVVSAGLVSP